MTHPEQSQDPAGTEVRPAATAPAAKPRRSRLREPAVFLSVVALAAILRLFVYESDIVEGSSMRPGLRSGDYLLISKLSYHFRKPGRFDVVTFPSPVGSKEVLVKRVVGLPNEFVFCGAGAVLINGKRLAEPYAVGGEDYLGIPVWVPPGYIFVLGDNRENSEDSRVWGPVPIKSIRGKAVASYYPFSRAHWLDRRGSDAQ
jgi:signal peptidase I